MVKSSIFSTNSEAAERLNDIIEQSFDGIFITDGNATVIKINHAYETITGLSKEDLLGRNMEDLVNEKIISQSGSLIVKESKQPVTLQQYFKTKKQALITSSPIFDKSGNLIMIVTNVRDLTEIYNLKQAVRKKEEKVERLKLELSHLQDLAHTEELIIQDDASLSVLLLARRVAPLDTTVILLGETGVGKEVLAHYIYKNSTRANNSFIKVNCGAIPPALIESELFGYDKGAFTGASSTGKMGLFELANKGTLFLDEVGELPKDMQVKLLRAIQEQEILRVGGTKAIKINTRIIAATNRNLEELVQQNKFREDLYYRLTVFPIYIPPLRIRKNDIVPLAKTFLERLNKKYGFRKSLTAISLQLLHEYKWPGNIRELKNVIERAVVISTKDEITPHDLHIHVHGGLNEKPLSTKEKATPLPENLKETLESIEYNYLKSAYEQYGNVRDAAKSLGITASTFVRKRLRYEQNSHHTE